MRVITSYQGAVSEAVAAIKTKVEELGGGAQAHARVMAEGAGYDTLGGRYVVTNPGFPCTECSSLAAAIATHAAINSANPKRIWHISVAGHRRLVLEG